MVAKTLTISMSEEDYIYLGKDSMLSPSKIFQVALHNIRENRKNWDEQIKMLRMKCEVMQKKIFELNDVLEKERATKK